MNKILIAACAALLLFSCTSKTPTNRPLSEIFSDINRNVTAHSSGYDDLREATSTIGHRLTGSENGAKAEVFVLEKFRKYGFEDATYLPFEVEAWARKSISLDIMSDDTSFSLKTVALAHSPVHADVQGQLIFAGSGLRKDLKKLGDAIRGNIILANIGLEPQDSTEKNLHRSEKTALAIDFGAAGVILYNRVEGNILLTGTASVTGELNPIPAANISWEDGQMLKDLMNQGKQLSAHLAMENASNIIKARNVVATLRGSGKPEEVILIGGHLDSWDLATGAIDNGIGSFTVLDIARTFKSAGLHPERTIQFVMFMGEEQGLLGSKYMAQQMIASGEIDKLRYIINLDMSGNPKGFSWSGREEMKDFFNHIGTTIQTIDSTFSNEGNAKSGLHSDHFPFMLEGIPVLGMISNMNDSIYKYYHSNGDDFNLIDKSWMVNGTRYTAMALYALADADSIPAGKLNSDEAKEFFIRQGFKEEMVVGKTWKWEE
ncbi:MAG: M20/M25/M40 family metallo-hydrolase [Flavobacteriales bacterium]|nr:M20/M25/M40 family metallo-hydrolase [Flavobacteriales bacterium]